MNKLICSETGTLPSGIGGREEVKGRLEKQDECGSLRGQVMTASRGQWDRAAHDSCTAPPGPPCSHARVRTKYLGVSDHVELDILLQLVLVVLIEQEVLLFRGQGLEGLVGGPEDSDRGVDRISDDAQQARILKHRVGPTLCKTQR